MSTSKTNAGGTIEGSREAKRRAVAVLEVLSGLASTAEAAEGLGVGLPRYYQLETYAMQGLIAGLEPRPRGRVKTEAARIAELEAEIAQLRRELSGAQTLVRQAQRAVGLPRTSASTPKGKGQSSKPKRRGRARAVKLAESLKASDPPDGES